MILSLPFWILSICVALFVEKPESHTQFTQADQASMTDIKSLTTEGLSNSAQTDADGTGTPTL